MRIQILGTAAAEGWPGIFCGCDTCRRARAAGGNDYRSRASLQIDDVYKIDLPPDTYYHAVRFGLDLSRLRYLFSTHSHGDHFAVDEMEYLRPGFAHNLESAPIRIYGNPKVIGALKERVNRFPDMPIRLDVAEPFIPIQADHLTFTPVTAAHAPGQQALNYIVQSESAAVLYASDTGLYERGTMDHIARYRFDLLIVECTQGTLDMPSKLHMGLDGVLELRERLAKRGAVDGDSRWVITHFSHNIGLLHDELQEVAAREGIVVAYDGMVLDV